MKISTKGRYGLRAVLDLAMHYGKEHVALHQIAQRQDLSVQYLEQMFSALRKAGIVRSVKGAGGGYTLVDAPESISAGVVLRALEGDLSLLGHLQHESEGEINLMEKCIREMLWKQIDDRTNEILEGITLKDLAEVVEHMESQDSIVFYI